MDHRSSCRQARYWAALAPDEVLSEFELRLLGAHVSRCADCRAFAADVAGFAESLRAVPLERPQVSIRFRAPVRRRLPSSSLVTGVASAAAALAIMLVVPLEGETSQPSAIDRPAIVIDATSIESGEEEEQFLSELRDYRNAQHVTESEVARVRKPGILAG